MGGHDLAAGFAMGERRSDLIIEKELWVGVMLEENLYISKNIYSNDMMEQHPECSSVGKGVGFPNLHHGSILGNPSFLPHPLNPCICLYQKNDMMEQI